MVETEAYGRTEASVLLGLQKRQNSEHSVTPSHYLIAQFLSFLHTWDSSVFFRTTVLLLTKVHARAKMPLKCHLGMYTQNWLTLVLVLVLFFTWRTSMVRIFQKFHHVETFVFWHPKMQNTSNGLYGSVCAFFMKGMTLFNISARGACRLAV